MKKLLLILLALIPSVAFAGTITRDGFIYEEKSAPSNPPANRHHSFYDSSDQRLKILDSSGVEHEVIFFTTGDTKTDEFCVTYEATGNKWELQACGSGGGDSITVDGVAVVDPDFDDGGDINFTDTSNVITATINAGSVDTTELADGAATNAKLADMANATTKCRATLGTGDPEDCTAAQVRAILNVEDGATADQTGAEIKAAYEAEADTNALTDARAAVVDATSGTNTGDEVAASTAEVDAGSDNTKMVTPLALNGSSPALAQPTMTNTITATTGTIYGTQDTTTVNPSASSDAIITALNGTAIVSNTQTITGSGHAVGVLGTGLHNTTTTFPLLIGTEGLIQKITTGTVTETDGLLSHTLGNAGALTQANGTRNAITDNDGTITEYNGALLTINNSGGSGTITTVNGVKVGDLDEGTGSIGDVVGLKIVAQTDTFGSIKVIDNDEPSADIVTAGDIVLEGSTSGSVTVAVPAVAGSNTVTLPASTGTVRLDEDGGRIIQIAETGNGTGQSGTATLPTDTSIPQNTEGNEFYTQAITPDASSDKLVIDFKMSVVASVQSYVTCALFQDSTANALYSTSVFHTVGGVIYQHVGHYKMTAGTGSSTTFKVRCGMNVAGTTYLNRDSTNNPLMGGTLYSFLRITDYRP